MKVKLLGVRGSLPTPVSKDEYTKKIQRILHRAIDVGLNNVDEVNNFIKSLPENLQYNYGGNTTCITVISKSGQVYILDCGSGMRSYGEELVKGECGRGEGRLKIFLTHTHWDHIQGIPFFKPMYIPGNIIDFFSPYKDLHERLIGQMAFTYFPAPFDETACEKNFYLLDERKTTQLEDNFFVDCHALYHPGGSYALRFQEGNKIFILATDAEVVGSALEQTGSREDFFMNADLLILDSQYTLDESFSKFDWGHTSYTVAVNCGVRWGIKHLVLSHHEPGNSDDKLREIHLDAVKHRNNMDSKTPIIHMAREGMTFAL